MQILERFRRRPDWEHSDPLVRASAVRQLTSDQADLIASIAQGDQDGRVRRAAIKRIENATLLASIAAADPDPSVREEAYAALVNLALLSRDESAGRVAIEALRDAKDLAAIAKEARLPELRSAALGRLSEPRHLVSVAKGAAEPATRQAALDAIHDLESLVDVASRCEHKDTALAALARVEDPAALGRIAERARAKGVARRARCRVQELAPVAEARPPRPSAEELAEEQALYEKTLAEQERLVEGREQAVATRQALCETVESLRGGATRERLEAARADWNRLPALDDPRIASLSERFESACQDAARRQESWAALQERLPRLEALCQEMEGLARQEPAPAVFRTARELRQAWTALLREGEIDSGLAERFQRASGPLDAREHETRETEKRRGQQNKRRLEALCARLDGLVASAGLSLGDAERGLREARAAIAEPGPLPSVHEREALVERLKTARSALFPRAQELREADDWNRWANVTAQEELCRRTEALLAAEDLEQAARELRQIDEEWKKVRQVPKEQAEPLWKRFRAARDQVRARCDTHFAAKAAELAENLARKQALCEQAEALSGSSEWVKTAEALRCLQEEWKKVGPVSHRHSAEVWRRFRAACDKFFDRRKADLTERKSEWARNLELKEALCQQAEALAESTEWESAARELKRLQGEWRKIGAVRRSRSEAIWHRFRQACDTFFTRYKDRDQLERAALRADLEAACAALEGLSADPSTGPELGQKLTVALSSWAKLAGQSRAESEPLEARFNAARDRLLEARPEAFAGTELDPVANAAKLEKLCARLEALELPELSAEAASDVEALSRRLRDALATNTLGGRAALEARWKELLQEVDGARAARSRVGPIPGPLGGELEARFESACRRITKGRPRSLGR
jgi:hypothetical protein